MIKYTCIFISLFLIWSCQANPLFSSNLFNSFRLLTPMGSTLFGQEYGITETIQNGGSVTTTNCVVTCPTGKIGVKINNMCTCMTG